MKTQLLAMLALVCFLLTGCRGKVPPEVEQAPETVKVSGPEETSAPPETAPPVPTDPLTGLETEKDLKNLRPYAVVLNNLWAAQPQCGQLCAGVIYEALAEGGITRMLAVCSDPARTETLGSIRSLRPYFLELAQTYDALLIHAGGSPNAYSRMEESGWESLDGVNGAISSGYFYRDEDRMAYGIEHSMFIHPADALACVERVHYRTEHEPEWNGCGLHFQENGTPEDGTPASAVKAVFPGGKTTDFTYDPVKSCYTAAQYGAPYTDGNTGEAVPFVNVLLLEVRTGQEDEEGRLEMALTGEGRGIFACGGKKIPIRWQREENGPFLYFREDDTELLLGCGRSYIALLPELPSIA